MKTPKRVSVAKRPSAEQIKNHIKEGCYET